MSLYLHSLSIFAVLKLATKGRGFMLCFTEFSAKVKWFENETGFQRMQTGRTM